MPDPLPIGPHAANTAPARPLVPDPRTPVDVRVTVDLVVARGRRWAPLAGDLRRHDVDVRVAHELHDELRATPDAVLFDLDSRALGGLASCRRIRRRSTVPIIGLSRRTGACGGIRSLQAGLDDHVAGHWCGVELAARVRAVLRRSRCAARRDVSVDGDTVDVGPMRLRRRPPGVQVNGVPILLTPTEHELLALFASNPDAVFTRSQISEAVWGTPDVAGRAIDTTIARLRRKLGEKAWIVTVHGVGFRMGGSLRTV
ncbi:response regulator transcription factor [Pseudonocardia endophytica]|uniref:DNA-binding response OmpR family regulator n=1 Tax=Pseudonocardia endophytica TaxID=401976 RepID=A0A4R1HIJ7_PSEEN|nr:response regulator transcription factor [Pseudonocardia endophytica]TCK22077.1 DNA-binding response OmpR family regulator [Pseudonocardia endophytica]